MQDIQVSRKLLAEHPSRDIRIYLEGSLLSCFINQEARSQLGTCFPDIPDSQESPGIQAIKKIADEFYSRLVLQERANTPFRFLRVPVDNIGYTYYV